MKIPEHWHKASVGAIFPVIGGGTPATAEPRYWNGKVPWITSADIDDSFGLNPRRCVTTEGLENSPARAVPKNSVIVATRVSLGKVGVVKDGALSFSQDCQALLPVKGLDPRFTAYQLKWIGLSFAHQARGTTISGITKKQLTTAPFFLAPTPEQARVADAIDELLSEVDAGNTALKRVHKKLGVYRASVMKSAFAGGLTSKWRAKRSRVETASDLLRRILEERRQQWEEAYKKKYLKARQPLPNNWQRKYREPLAPDVRALPALPAGWCWASFDQIGLIQGGLQKSPNRTPSNHHYPYLRVANVHRGSLDLRHLHRFELSDDELNRLRLQSGDMLIVEGNGSRTEIGRSAIWKDEVKDCVHQNHIIRVRPLPGIRPRYLDYFLNSPIGQLAIQLVASSTSGLYTLNITKIKRLPIALAPTTEQDEVIETVEDQLSVIDHWDSVLNGRIQSVEALCLAILRRGFTGGLAGRNAKDGSAADLFKDIAAGREKVKGSGNGSRRISKAIKKQRRRKSGVK